MNVRGCALSKMLEVVLPIEGYWVLRGVPFFRDGEESTPGESVCVAKVFKGPRLMEGWDRTHSAEKWRSS